MKTSDILKWIITESVNGEFLNTIHVPEEGEEEWEQNETWWLNTMGGLPPSAIPSGNYLYYYESAIPNRIHTNEKMFKPDAEIELSEHDGFDYIYLYKLNDE